MLRTKEPGLYALCFLSPAWRRVSADPVTIPIAKVRRGSFAPA